MNALRRCYICGTTLIPVPPGYRGRYLPKHETRDHVPPEGLFCDPKPSNLVTVPCCYECNNSHSAADEQFRALTALQLGANDAGRKIAMDKVFGSTMKKARQPNFFKALAQTMKPVTVTTPRGAQTVIRFSTDATPVVTLVRDMVRGLLYSLHPDFDYRFHRFHVEAIPFAKMRPVVDELGDDLCGLIMKHCKEDGRGNYGEFRFWRQLQPATQRGAWLLLFYNAVAFIVIHEPSALLAEK